MDSCNISLVKQEIVELIKTEPQNEDRFDMCRLSEIKTEDSVLMGDFKDTINYETHNFQTKDMEIKSSWDFLPIKEQIKDESDTSNSVDEIVKTETKLYDSSLNIMNSNRDHFTPVDKPEFQIKLEQDQSTLSSEILQSNIVAQTSSDFNLSIKCVNENKYLSFNALHKKQECRKLLPKRLCCELKENSTTEYKTSFLNSDQSKYGKEHKGAFYESEYKTQDCSYNNLTGEEFKDNIEINISTKHPKLGGVCVSTEVIQTKCKYENYTRIGGHCIAHRIRKKCKTDNCTKKTQKGSNCIAHGGGFKFKTENCSKFALKGGICFAHGGGRKCITKYCIKKAQVGGHCRAHGGRRKCKTENCTKCPRLGGYCIVHGGGRKCITENCTKNAHVGGHCIEHGKGNNYKTDNCTKKAQSRGHCIVHGGGRKCKTENCYKKVQTRDYCIVHGGGMKCKTENCTKNAQVGGHCRAHGGGMKCKTENCSKCALKGGFCFEHGGGRICKTEDCTKMAQVRGHCIAHGGRRNSKTEN